jgi:hypothetical protein
MSADKDPSTLTEAELPMITPLEFVLGEREDGSTTLDVREGEFEQAYSLRDPYSCILFVALCRREGVRIYRRPRQRTSTLCVKTTVSRHQQLWERFLVLSEPLDRKLAEITQQFVREEVESSPR